MGVEKIKDLQHDEGIEDDSEVPRINFSCLKSCFVLFITVQVIVTAAAYRASQHPVPPLVLGMRKERFNGVVAVGVLRNKLLAGKYDKEQYY